MTKRAKSDLKSWMSQQRDQYHAGTLSSDQIAWLESTPGWSWDLSETRWTEMFELALAGVEESVHFNPNAGNPKEKRLATWYATQRVAQRKRMLSSNQIARLESIPGWNNFYRASTAKGH